MPPVLYIALVVLHPKQTGGMEMTSAPVANRAVAREGGAEPRRELVKVHLERRRDGVSRAFSTAHAVVVLSMAVGLGGRAGSMP